MDRVNLLAFPTTAWEASFLEDTSLRRRVLEHYDQEHVSLRRYLSFLSVDPETAQEIVQETFLKLHEHLRSGRDRSNLRAWLYRVAHNLARNAQAAFNASRTDSLDPGTCDLPVQAASAEQELLAEERIRRLRRAMQELSKAQRECLVLRAEGLKYREISEILDISVSTVGENVQRGLERLKEMI